MSTFMSKHIHLLLNPSIQVAFMLCFYVMLNIIKLFLSIKIQAAQLCLFLNYACVYFHYYNSRHILAGMDQNISYPVPSVIVRNNGA